MYIIYNTPLEGAMLSSIGFDVNLHILYRVWIHWTNSTVYYWLNIWSYYMYFGNGNTHDVHCMPIVGSPTCTFLCTVHTKVINIHVWYYNVHTYIQLAMEVLVMVYINAHVCRFESRTCTRHCAVCQGCSELCVTLTRDMTRLLLRQFTARPSTHTPLHNSNVRWLSH
jgi:hypothetical protein